MLPQIKEASSQVVYLLDDRPSDMELVEKVCENLGLPTQIFDSPSEFLKSIDSTARGCLITDMLMPSMSGLELFQELRERDIHLATIIATGFADANTCRAAFQAGVFDFIDKEVSPTKLANIIQIALAKNSDDVARQAIKRTRLVRMQALTSREVEVARLLSQGDSLKEVGTKLKISVQTASKHRSNIFDKLAVANEVELHQAMSDCEEFLCTADRPTPGRIDGPDGSKKTPNLIGSFAKHLSQTVTGAV